MAVLPDLFGGVVVAAAAIMILVAVIKAILTIIKHD